MDNQYLVIKLPGNWIQREQCKQYFKHSVTQERGGYGTERGLVIKAQITLINDHPSSGADMRGTEE